MDAGAFWRRHLSRQRVVELVASTGSIASTILGTSTEAGAIVGVVAGVPWWWLMIAGRMWGLLPLNVGMLVALIWNAVHGH